MTKWVSLKKQKVHFVLIDLPILVRKQLEGLLLNGADRVLIAIYTKV